MMVVLLPLLGRQHLHLAIRLLSAACCSLPLFALAVRAGRGAVFRALVGSLFLFVGRLFGAALTLPGFDLLFLTRKVVLFFLPEVVVAPLARDCLACLRSLPLSDGVLNLLENGRDVVVMDGALAPRVEELPDGRDVRCRHLPAEHRRLELLPAEHVVPVDVEWPEGA